MTREEEIIQVIKTSENAYEAGWVLGDIVRIAIEWADEHPVSPWISVEDRLPDDNEVVVIAYKWGDGIRYGSDVYHSDFGWEGYDDDAIIAWMPIPPVEKGGAE